MRLVCLCLFLLSCSSPSTQLNEWASDTQRIKVLSTTAMIDDIVAKIGQERINHEVLIRGEIDPHSYELVKGDDEKLSLAQIVFFNGLGLEHGASLNYRLKMHPKAIGVGDWIRKAYPNEILTKDAQIDPHVWMDAFLWAEIVHPIVTALTDVDPEGAAFFEANGARVKEELKQLHSNLLEKFNSVPASKKYLVTSHDAFNYFTHRYLNVDHDWESRVRAPEGLAPDGQLSCNDIQNIIDYLCAHQVEIVFPESNVSRDSLRKIVSACQEKGLKVKISSEILYADTLGSPGGDAGTYPQMMTHNTTVLTKAWE